MTGIDIRGGCAGMSLELTGEFTGYNNAATMQVGLWIRNDGECVDMARGVALNCGPRVMAEQLLHLMSDCWHNMPGKAPAQAYAALMHGELSPLDVDWAQIAYDLIGDEPDDDDLSRAAEEIEEQNGRDYVYSDDEVYRHARRWRELWARERALGIC